VKVVAVLAVVAVFAAGSLAQSSSTGHFDKKGNWIPARQSKAKKPKSQEIKITPVKIPQPPKPKRQPKPAQEFRSGYHQEYQYVAPRRKKDGSYTVGEFRWVWVKDPSWKRPKKPKPPKHGF
jgi:hypothetical protein